ncbi:restriction endonuclease subunit S [Vibrio cholerae]
MTGRYKAYPEYKDSGVEWVGDIPTDWSMWKLAHAFNDIGSGTTPPTNNEEWFLGNIPWITTGELREKIIIDTNKKLSDSALKNYPTLRKYPVGSVAIAMYGATIGRLGILGIEATTNQACCVMTISKQLYNKYLFYWLWAFKEDIIRLSSGGGQPNINQEKVASLKVSAPQPNEQQKIANFLDHETAKIDTLITKQEKLIELLKEKRQAVISHAVTKGLNPDAPMKDSGVEWLGKVPEHWVVCCLKHIKGEDKGSFVDGPFGSNLKSEHFVDNGDVYVIESNFATTGLLDTTKLKTISTEHFETISRSETTEGAIIIAKIGARYGMNSVMPALDKKAVVSGNSLSLKINDKAMDVQYCHHLLTHLKQEGAMDDGVNVTAQPALSLGQLNNLPFLRPSKEEQQAIVNFVQQQEKSLSSLILNAERMIELSRERKTALISAAVTGKIDVRDWQPKGVQG